MGAVGKPAAATWIAVFPVTVSTAKIEPSPALTRYALPSKPPPAMEMATGWSKPSSPSATTTARNPAATVHPGSSVKRPQS